MPPRGMREKKAVTYAESSQSNEGGDDAEASLKSEASDDDDDDDSPSPSTAESAASDSPKPKKGKNAKEPAAKKTTPAKSPGNKKTTESSSSKATAGVKTTGVTGVKKKTEPAAASSSGGRSNGGFTAQLPSSAAAVSSGPDITQGPPVTTDGAAKKLILQYMKQQNRPYSSLQIFDNLHKRIPKATLERVVTSLSGEGEELKTKEYGKMKIYYADQSKVAMEASEDAFDDLRAQVGVLQAEATATMQQEKDLQRQLQELRNEPNDEMLDDQLEKLSAELAGKKRKADALTEAADGGGASSSKKVHPHALRSAVKCFNDVRQAWIDRKRQCLDLVDSMSDSMNKKRNVIANDLGLEMDSQVPPPKMVVPP